MKRVFFLFFVLLCVCINANAQSWLEKMGNRVKEKVVEKVEQRIEDKTDEATDKVLDKSEEAVKQTGKNKQKKTESGSEDANAEEDGTQPSAKQKLTGTTQYDFVPGDKILYFEDFSQDAIGDFPALWTTNGGGEVKSVNIAPGKWFHLNGENAVYCYTRKIDFPDNFIVEFDIIPDEEYSRGIVFTLYQENNQEPKELNDDLYPGTSGLHITPKYDGWETLGYKESEDWITGEASKNPVVREENNHVIIWIQKRRVRIYHQGAKIIDMPTNIYPDTKFNRIRFSGWDRYSTPYVTNLKITTASPDTRSKLITEGKLITYGITFDVNKADVKAESYGTLKSIADVLQENASVKVKIFGHTDSDGDDAKNLELSLRRAQSVKNELVSKFGIDASRMETEGAGETTPVAPNDTPANKALNRRVEFVKI